MERYQLVYMRNGKLHSTFFNAALYHGARVWAEEFCRKYMVMEANLYNQCYGNPITMRGWK